ncbi:MAG: amidohydrolase family protein, partial [Saprospiraceae bacterium]
LSSTGIPRPEQAQTGGQGGARGQQQRPTYDTGNPPNDVAGITPEVRVKDVFKANDKSIEELRKAGFTVAHVVPRGNMLPGTGAIVLLSGDATDKMVLRDQTSFFSQLTGAQRAYPNTVIAVMAKYRELYKQAELAKAHEAAYQKNPAGMARPNYSRTLQAFYPVIEKKQPVFFAAPDMKSIHRIFTLQNDLKFPMVLADLKQGWYVADKIKAANVPVFLTLDLPKEKKKDEKKKDAAAMSITDKEMEALEKRRAEEMKQHLMQAATFEKKGVEFGFSALSAKTTDIKENLRKMVENGLSENAALAALTTTPAKTLGISNIAGTVEKGKLANLVVTDKPYFADKSNVRYVFVDGKMYQYDAPAPKKAADPTAPVAKIGGKWNYTLDMGGQSASGVIELKDEGGNISGTISNPQTGQNGTISNAVLNGKNLTFNVSYDMGGRAIKVDFDLEFTGDEFEGTASVGQFGSFKVEGAKNPGN